MLHVRSSFLLSLRTAVVPLAPIVAASQKTANPPLREVRTSVL